MDDKFWSNLTEEEKEFYRQANNEDYLKRAYDIQDNKRTEILNNYLQEEADLKANQKQALKQQDMGTSSQRYNQRHQEYNELFNSKQ
ncbi:hypothetical protein [Paraclostridium dentum]|uniref:hypothetical protein n=1 Tax=Paraclostridium dentum TaxID=2662455 RepID=UPI003F3AA3B7